MFPRRLLQVGRGEGEEDTQQGGALLVGQFSSTYIKLLSAVRKTAAFL